MGEFTYARMKACFALLKELAIETRGSNSSGGNSIGTTNSRAGSDNNGGNQEQEQRVAELEQLVMQRDNEIAILVKLIRKQRAGGASASDVEIPEELLTRPLQPLTTASGSKICETPSGSPAPTKATQRKTSQAGSKAPAGAVAPPVDTSFAATFQVDPAVLDDPTKAFEAFRAQYPQSSAIRENKALLKQKYEAAKALATVVNDARQQIKTLTAQIDKVRKQQAIADEGLLAAETNEASTASAEDVALENKLKDQIEQHKAVYKKGFNDLSELKKEIQHIQKLLEMGRLKLQKDFDLWYQRQGKSALLTEALLAADAKPSVSNNQRDDAATDRKSAGRPSKSSSPVKRPPTMAPQDGRQSSTPRSSVSSRSESPRDARKTPQSSVHRCVCVCEVVQRRWCFFVIDDQWAFVYSSSVEDDVSGFYEALDILKRRNARK
ncbi:hypothetical protein PINS_up013724 [Pythium insidiosum]|nr:hypothetical protein PINS_up013724 [Pythium insidiosum]